MYGNVTNEGRLETQEQRTERRLEIEARGVNLGTIDKTDGNTPYDTVRAEVSWRAGDGTLEHAGFFTVRLPEVPGFDELDEYEQHAKHPAELARVLVLEELERRYPDSDYVSVDDTYAA